jgi:hypothetical protein
LKQRLSRAVSVKLASTLTIAAVACLALAPALASGAAEESNPLNTVYIKDGKKGLRFVAPKFIYKGEELTILNTTNPRKVGPHTFSMVEASLIPKTGKARQQCFTPKHICMAVAHWHGTNGHGPITKNPAKAGEPGWDTEGNLTKKGDSWFTGTKPNATISQVVSAPAGTEITFMCAIHPWMHGTIEVRQGPTG